MPTATAHLATIEDFLGPAEGRFFGEGFKRVTHRLTEVRVGRDQQDQGYVSARASAEYPPGWSRKSRAVVSRPHLSSIDGLVFAAQLAEAYLTHVHGLDEGQRCRMWLRRLDMRAGVSPQEDLDQFDVHGLLVRTVPAETVDPTEAVSTMQCAVGTMIVQVELAHALSPGTAAIGAYARIEDLLGDGDQRYYGDGYKQRSQIVRDVEVDEQNRWARADVRVAFDDSGDEAAHGLGAHYQPTASMIDFITPLAQLAQVLLYRTDGLDRGSSNTLWLRRVVMTASTPRLPMHADAVLRVSKSRVVELDGRAWRIMDATSDVPGLRTWSSCAHQLPAALLTDDI
jgi:hypothetical protein